MTRESIRGSSDRSVLVLTSLATPPKHGYALIKDIEAFAGVKLGPWGPRARGTHGLRNLEPQIAVAGVPTK